jgi:hypothetical protein
MYINDKYACESDAVYGVRAATEGGDKGAAMSGHSHAGASMDSDVNPAIKTISSMTPCKGPMSVKKGDTMKLVAEYDLSKHPLRKSASGGKAADVMGMLGVSFAADK